MLAAPSPLDRRQFLHASARALTGGALTASLGGCGAEAFGVLEAADTPPAADRPALIAITLDLEMSRNFPTWETTHWDYEKGNLDADTKRYAVEAGRRVKAQGGLIHYFCVGRVLEQEDVSWLTHLAETGHKIGNHTYDHVYVLATRPQDLQFRFQRSPWLIEGLTPAQAIERNIRMTTTALRQRTGIVNDGFRTPGGFATGLEGREDVQKLLLDAGFTWVSSKYPAHKNSAPHMPPTPEVRDSVIQAQAAAQPFVYPTGLIEVPMSPVSDINAFRTGRWKLEWFLEMIELAVRWAIAHQATFDFLAHPSCLVATDPQFQALDLICRLVAESQGRARLVDLNALAARARPLAKP